MVKFGASMLSWIPRWTAEGGRYAIGKAAENGFDLLEISLPPSLEIDVRGLKKELLTAGIGTRFTLILPAAYHLPFYPGKALNHLKAALDIVEEAGGRFLGGVFYASIGVFTGKPCTREERQILKDVLSEAAAYAAAKEIMLALEPVNRYETYVLTSAQEALDLIVETGAANLGLMLDTFHMNIEERNFYKPVVEAGRALHYIHITGSDRGMPGEDHIPWGEFFRGLVDIHFEGDLVLENFSSHVEGLAAKTALWRRSRYPPDELAMASLQFIKNKAVEYGLIPLGNSFENSTANH